MKAILVNHNYTPEWLKQYDFDYTIFDRSDSKDYLKDFPQERIIYTSNVGNIDYDKLHYLIDNYDNLPEIFLWGKSNLFKYISQPEFDNLDLNHFQPLLTQHHRIYSDSVGAVNYYQNGMYYERNDSWYLKQHQPKYVANWEEWSRMFHLPNPAYLSFPPGGNFILTREKVHMYGKDMYERMAATLDYTTLPGEAQLCERTYHLLWSMT